MAKFTFDQQIEKIVKENNGYLRIVDVQNQGFSKYRILSYIQSMGLKHMGAGVYVNNSAKEDWMYYLQLRNRNIVFSYESALYLNGLSKKKPKEMVISVVRGYNAKHIKDRGVVVHTVPPEWFELGIIKANTDKGNPVRIYDQERCICDMVRRRGRVDQKIMISAMSKYFDKETEDYTKLREYAKIMGIESKIDRLIGPE